MNIYKDGNSFAIQTRANCPVELAQEFGEAISKVINDPKETYGEDWAFQLTGLAPLLISLHDYLSKGNINGVEIFAHDDILICGDPDIIKKEYRF